MKVSVVVPSKGCEYLRFLLFSLREQSTRPHEVVLVVKECSVKLVESLCSLYSLPCTIVEQKRGFFTVALNMGKRIASGDIVLFTDDDAIAPKGWIKRYIKAFTRASKDVASVSSRDVYIKLDEFRIAPTLDDYLHTMLYRWFIRTWLEPPLELLKEYRFGVYVSKRLNVVHGPYLPSRACLSLSYRGVNMAFRREVIDEVEFPEHPELKRAPGNEQYVSLKLILKGFKTVYIPNNPILHIYREDSLSRIKDKRLKKEMMREVELMRSLYLKMLSQNSIRVSSSEIVD
ncbi:MAG: glycosyltransferase family 2 protein [Desulfurococcaceae archaeon]